MICARCGYKRPTARPNNNLVPTSSRCSCRLSVSACGKNRADLTKITVDEVAATGDVDSAFAEFFSERVQQVAQNSGVSNDAIREWFDRALITEAGIRSEVMKGPKAMAAERRSRFKNCKALIWCVGKSGVV